MAMARELFAKEITLLLLRMCRCSIQSERRIEYVEIVDIKSSDEESSSDIYTCWEGFTHTKHLKLIDSIWDSWAMTYPRRSVVSLMSIQFDGEPVETFSLDRSEETLR